MRAALFDLDETILDRSASLREFVVWQAERMLRGSISNPHQFVERFIELDQHGMVWKDAVYSSLIDEFGISDWSVDELLTSYCLTFCAFCKPRDGALAAIDAFRRHGFSIGLVSNGKTPFQERNFHALGLSQLFDCVVVSEAVGIRKPDPAIFAHACELLNADIAASLFIGDNPVADIEAAKNAGMGTIYVPTDSQAKPCAYADTTVSHLSEIVAYLDRERKLT